ISYQPSAICCHQLLAVSSGNLIAESQEPRAESREPLYSVPLPLHLVDHPLVHDALVELRDKETLPEHFRRAATRISVLLAAEALRDAPHVDVTVDTPIGPAPGRR